MLIVIDCPAANTKSNVLTFFDNSKVVPLYDIVFVVSLFATTETAKLILLSLLFLIVKLLFSLNFIPLSSWFATFVAVINNESLSYKVTLSFPVSTGKVLKFNVNELGAGRASRAATQASNLALLVTKALSSEDSASNAVLAALTFPAVFYFIDNIWIALTGVAVAIILSLFNQKLIVVALVSVLVVFGMQYIL